MIESAALAARIQASQLFQGCSIPEGPSLWAEVMNWACDAYNRTATVANSGNRSPHEMFYEKTPQSSPIPFLKPGFCKFKRTDKMDQKAREYFYLGPARIRLNQSKRVLVQTGKVIIKGTLPGLMYPFYVLQPQGLRPRWKGRAVNVEETERQARSAVLLNRGMMSLSR